MSKIQGKALYLIGLVFSCLMNDIPLSQGSRLSTGVKAGLGFEEALGDHFREYRAFRCHQTRYVATYRSQTLPVSPSGVESLSSAESTVLPHGQAVFHVRRPSADASRQTHLTLRDSRA